MNYKTVYNRAQAEFIEKKSRFIASVAPVDDAAQADAFIKEIKKQHNKATHNVFAYRCGLHNEAERQSDDGEPSGTAGAPVLELLKKMQLHNTAVVVTRYYGGILLGAGGLIRAYGSAAKEGVLAAGVLEVIPYQQLFIKADYSLLGKLQYEIPLRNGIISNILYQTDVEIEVLVLPQTAQDFITSVTEITNASASISAGSDIPTRWLDGKML